MLFSNFSQEIKLWSTTANNYFRFQPVSLKSFLTCEVWTLNLLTRFKTRTTTWNNYCNQKHFEVNFSATQKKHWQNFSDACCPPFRQMQSCVFKLGYIFKGWSCLKSVKGKQTVAYTSCSVSELWNNITNRTYLITSKGQKQMLHYF